MVDFAPAVEALARATALRPRILMVLGSGLGALTDELADADEIRLDELPGLPRAAVEGHEGRLLAGRLDGTPVWMHSGRLHVYEGHAPEVVAAPVRIAAELGVETAILTNAAGGIRGDLDAGALVLLDDVLNLSFRDPLAGPGARDVGSPNPRASEKTVETFDPALRALASSVAHRRGVRLERGVYASVLGPSFETPAEIRMIRRLGGDVVGMSTVPEVLALRQAKVRALGISLVTNRAAGLQPGTLSHAEVVEGARRRAPLLATLVRGLVGRIGEAYRRGKGGGSTK